METLTYPHITIDAKQVARIGQTRYKVLHLAGEHFHYGWSAEEMMRQHPDLRPEEVYAALTFFYDHYESMVEQLDAQEKIGEEVRRKQTLSRAELLKRAKENP